VTSAEFPGVTPVPSLLATMTGLRLEGLQSDCDGQDATTGEPGVKRKAVPAPHPGCAQPGDFDTPSQGASEACGMGSVAQKSARGISQHSGVEFEPGVAPQQGRMWALAHASGDNLKA